MNRFFSLFFVGMLIVVATITPSHSWGGFSNSEPMEMYHQKMYEWMARDLILTNAQRNQLETILKQKGEKIKKIYETVRPQIKEIRQQAETDIRGILTPDQQERFDKIIADHKKQMGEMKDRMKKHMKDHWKKSGMGPMHWTEE